MASHDDDIDDIGEEDRNASRTAGARRSRAERARVEIERRHNRSQSRTRTTVSSSSGSRVNSSAKPNYNSNSAGSTVRAPSSPSPSTTVSNNTSVSSSTGGNRSPMRSRFDKYEQKKMLKKSSRTPSDVSPTRRMRTSNSSSHDSRGRQKHSKSSRQSATSNNISSSVDQSQTRERHQSSGQKQKEEQSMPHRRQHAESRKAPVQMQQLQPIMQQESNEVTSTKNQPKTSYQQHQHNKTVQPLKVAPVARQKASRISTPSAAVSVGETTTSSSTNINSHSMKPSSLSVESPLPPLVQRALGDRSYDKRKNAALEVEALVKSLAEAATSNNKNFVNTDEHRMVCSVIHLLSTEFTGSMNAHFRKGGLIGLAATAIGLMPQNLLPSYLGELINPVLQGFDDTEPRVRYYACESMFNIVKVARKAVLPFFNPIFNGLAKLSADLDDEVRNGSNLLDGLVKDIVTECEEFSIDEFLPLMQNYIRRTNPFIRQLLVGWLTVLDSIPDVSMTDYLPYFLDGLFNMLSDSNLEIRQAADSALSEFLREVRESAVVEFDNMISILVFQCHSKERLNRLTGITWLLELIHHPHSDGDALLPFHSDVLGAILTCISDGQVEIRKVAERSNSDLLEMVKETSRDFELGILIDCLAKELTNKDDVLTKMAVLKWINMLLEKRRTDMDEYINSLMPALLQLLSDQSDGVVLLTVQVLSRISLSDFALKRGISGKENLRNEAQFVMVIKSILALFMADRRLLETRGSIIVRRLCVLLNAKSVYLIMADIISSYDVTPDEGGNSFTLEFVATMVQTLNLILLTASELNNLRQLLETSFVEGQSSENEPSTSVAAPASPRRNNGRYHANNEGARVFAALFHCWCNNPVSTFSLCLLGRAYDLAFSLVKKFSELEVTVGFLMQIDKLIHLIESPIFVHLRLRLLDVEAPFHTYLLKSCYGLLMLLPQSDAYRSLNDRLSSVCNLRDNLGIQPSINASPSTGAIRTTDSSIYQGGLDISELLKRFDAVIKMHSKAREAIQQKAMKRQDHLVDRNGINNGGRVHNAQRPIDQRGLGSVSRQR
uniref:Vacuolar protein 14 C-terminal Fig4-binding domain-containing protein n=1 Tax=Chaetoceros debilis TaxID=122233 RepID=A0A7S3Q0X9_9STRA|mmetsp:Transcript_19853/g.29234  ORF Transcript_19853/g.29234 Transcript_19853/m.29234 type:complete len:1063 (+) Transcript_19853:183-3371(+)|eukprot:CAMPEP_0194092856 /NCGR_PEP_ID=MMETSP0149-20130528/48218_1 /TAXON_ID=122233 /ORGANISM="Chaetoceros debilis, Strain MM31A-1" /LENGTH=1062 /DNA_ID=CAMNT_0038777935 /DNA_START=64 /DNA_END=3252 /DNA_ORIENTATION=+